MDNQQKIFIGGGAIAAAVVVFYYRKQKQKALDTSAATPDPATIDPATGQPWANEYGGAQQGYSPAYGGAQGTTPSLYGYTDPTTGAFIPTLGGTSGVITPSNHAQWAQMSIAYLTQIGYNGVDVAAALGTYLAGMGLTETQLAIVEAAIGAYGSPPAPFVPAPHLVSNTGQNTSGGTTSGGTTTSHTTALATPQLFNVGYNSRTKQTEIRWTPIPGAAFYLVLGNFFPRYTKSTTAWIHHGEAAHIRAYPSNYSTGGFLVSSGPHTVSNMSNQIKAR